MHPSVRSSCRPVCSGARSARFPGILRGIALVLAVASASVLGGCSSGSSADARVPDPQTARPVVDQMLEALQAKDPAALARLAPKGYVDTAPEAATRVRLYGGIPRSSVDVQVNGDLAPRVVAAHLSVRGAGALTWTENLLWDGTSWRLLIGHAPGASGKESTSGISPTP